MKNDTKNKTYLQKTKGRLRRAKNQNPWLLLVWHEWLRARGHRETRKYTDIQSINRLYHSHAVRYPDLENPTLFSEKQQWLKLNYRDPLMVQCADKFDVRKYIEDQGYAETLNELHGVYENVKEFDVSQLPDRFVLKAAHGSGWNYVCHDKNKTNWRPWKLIMKSWLKSNIFWNGREWVYKDTTPRIICEKYQENAGGGLRDYKFFCFNGEPCFVQANSGRGGQGHAQNFYDLNWKLQPFGKDLVPRPDVAIPKPQRLERMVEIARDLCSPFSFARADFYEVEGRVIFGELTFFPASGMPDFRPPEYDAIVGEMWTLPKKNN